MLERSSLRYLSESPHHLGLFHAGGFLRHNLIIVRHCRDLRGHGYSTPNLLQYRRAEILVVGSSQTWPFSLEHGRMFGPSNTLFGIHCVNFVGQQQLILTVFVCPVTNNQRWKLVILRGLKHMIHKGVDNNHRNPSRKSNISNSNLITIRSKRCILAMTNGAYDCKGYVSSVAHACHYYNEPEKSWGRSAHYGDKEAHKAPDDGAENYIHRYEPPVHHVLKGHHSTELSEYQTRKEEREHQLAQELGGEGLDKVDLGMSQDRTQCSHA
ncbi:hypothetical protein Mapa_016486 [Marchantia paleacea]|nr:hypothetical protein Mapa_016486 [Marchantia paleacea]